ncbi:MAG TPA: gliding motility-associated C-terminal domain-containing protein [Ferruginibacter sp.]|nr:gliding motility-associated C-terminal domain-containing protein [Ferruginibacter sp.]HMP20564.1 gliding motility-associated C-terminal domain-containing protein [Ferruginibacter sp.]
MFSKKMFFLRWRLLPVLLACFTVAVKAQVTFHFSAAPFNATTRGYEMPGVGTYFRDNGSSSGNISFNNSANCFGYTPGAPTSSNQFYFLPVFGNISKITVRGTGTGSNRVFSSLSVSATQNGTYTTIQSTATGTISGTTCNSIEIVPSTLLSSGVYIRLQFSGNLNVTSIDFLNNATEPVVSTAAATGVSCTTLTFNGSVDDDGGFAQVTRGFVYSTTNTTPTLADDVITDAGNSTGAFSATLTDLPQGTTYYVRAYGTTSMGTGYGAVQTVTTATPSTPVVSTTAVTNITSFGGQTGGDVTADGCTDVTVRGVVWSTSPNPELPSANTTTNGSGTGSFGSQIVGLAASTVYYVRAYATNSSGTAYGNEVTFTTAEPQPSLFANPTALNFPATAIGSSSSLTYTLTGENLTADGTVTITVPAGFTVSPASITYTGTGFVQTVTVTFRPTEFSAYSGQVTQSGGGAVGLYNVSPLLTGNGRLPIPDVTSNMGNDFWLGNAYHAQMARKDGEEANLSLYVAAPDDKPVTVVVEMPGLGGGFATQEIPLIAGEVREISGFPRGDNVNRNPSGAPDSRLFYTGISNRGIHVYTKDGTPVSLWMYSYSAQDAAAGSLIFPTNTWNTSYSVQAYGSNSNSAGNPNSFFFVIAEEDGTEIEFTPTVDILDSFWAANNNTTLFTRTPAQQIKYFAGQTYNITLNKGQVFNALSNIIGNFGQDLSGTTVRSTNCKKIAVFGGNGRSYLTTDLCPNPGSGSDNLVQQMFPKVAWGTKYYTVPTKHMEYNTIRIYVDDPATTVWVNNPAKDAPLTNIINNTYYEIYTNQPSVIEASRPISVTQFIASESCGSQPDYGMNGRGDPEMIILSPSAQAINKVTVYTPSFKNGNNGGAYINVVIPKDGINSFKLDPVTNLDQMVDTGSSSFIAGVAFQPADALIPIKDAFIPFDADGEYYWARFKVNFPEAHTLVSDIPFNAIAYGTAQGESYGFNAGTRLNDLSVPLIIENPYGGPSQRLNTCRGTAFKVSVVLPYETNKITVSFADNTPVTPATDTTLQAASGYLAADSTFEANGQTFYVYRIDRSYSFTQAGAFRVNVTAYDDRTTDPCAQGTDQTIGYNIDVIAGLNAAFDITYDKCINDSVLLEDKSDGLGYDIISWKWTYDNDSKAVAEPEGILQNAKIENPADNAAANYTLLAVNEIGCFNTVTKSLPASPLPDLVFTAPTPNPICSNVQPINLVATPAGGVFSGPGVTGSQFNPTTAGAGTHTLRYTFTVGEACSTFVEQTIVVNAAGTLTITPVNALCITDNAITLQGSPAGGTFSGPGVTGAQFNPATAGAGSHIITYTNGPCAQPVSTTIVVNNLPDAFAGPDIEETPVRVAVPFANATGTAGATYSWSPAQWLSDANVLNPVLTPEQLGTYTYTLTVSLGGGCVRTDDITVTVKGDCVTPKSAFTPNNDGFNDRWLVSNGQCAQQLKVSVYNRWGGLVFQSENYSNNWDGTKGGKPLPDGTYYYVIEAKLSAGTIRFYKGNVTIMR